MRKCSLPFWKQLLRLAASSLVCGGPLSHSGIGMPQLVLCPRATSCSGHWPLCSVFLLSHGFSCLISLQGLWEFPFLHPLVPTCGHTTVRKETMQLRGSLLTGLASWVRRLCISTAPCTLKTPALDLVFSPGKTLSSVTPPLYIVLSLSACVSVLSHNLLAPWEPEELYFFISVYLASI